MLRTTTLIAILALSVCGSLAASTITSDFNVDLDGWTAQHGLLVYNATGGNTGGYLEEDDNGQSNMQIVAPAKFLGNLSGYSISVDLNVLGTLPSSSFGGFGVLTLSSGALVMTADLGDPANGWTNYSTALTAAAFGNDVNFATIITNVTKIQLALDPSNKQTGDSTGVDNFTLFGGVADPAVPEPATAAILGCGLVAIGLLRRKNRSV